MIEHERDELADEIAHDAVEAPADDASEAETDLVFARVARARAAAYRALVAGLSREEAEAAARLA